MSTEAMLANMQKTVISRISKERFDLEDATERRDLRLTVPDGCPDDLGRELAHHNGAVADWEARRAANEKARSELPFAMLADDVTGQSLAVKASTIRFETFDCLRQHVALLQARKPLLGMVAPVLEGLEKDAEAAVETEKAKTRKGLTKQGYGPETDRGYRVDAAGAERRFEFRVNQSAGVASALESLAAAREACRNNAALLFRVDDDIQAVALKLAAAYQSVVNGGEV